jgi:hypothetical protein
LKSQKTGSEINRLKAKNFLVISCFFPLSSKSYLIVVSQNVVTNCGFLSLVFNFLTFWIIFYVPSILVQVFIQHDLIVLERESVHCLDPGPCYSDKDAECGKGTYAPCQTRPLINSPPGDSRDSAAMEATGAWMTPTH